MRWLRTAVIVFAALGLASVGASAAYTVTGKATLCTVGLQGVTITATCAGQTTRTAITNASGNYSFTNNLTSGKTYTLTPSYLAGYTITPATTTVSGATTKNFTVSFGTSMKYSISGVVTCGGAGLGGVTVRATGPGTYQTITSTTPGLEGTYTISNVQASCTNYTVTPSGLGLTYAPTSQSVQVRTGNVGGINFIANAPDVSISGQVVDCYGTGIGGVTVTAYEPIGGTTVTATTDAGGNYTFPLGQICGSLTFTLTPTLTDYSFSPASQSVTVSGSDVTVPDFVGVPAHLTISGRVTACDGSALAGATITATSGGTTRTATTGADGTYTITGFSGSCTPTTWTVTPTLTGYVFLPASQAVVLTGQSLTNVNFKENPPTSAFTISGTVTKCGAALAGVSVSTDTGMFTVTDSGGNYTITGLAGCTTYVVIPSLTGYTFTPGNLAVPVVRASVSGVNFVAADNTVGAWDPLKQVTQQILRPNLLIVQDVSGSMAWDINGSCCPVGVDSRGTSPTAAWTAQYWDTGTSTWKTCSGCSTTAKEWRYTLAVTQTFPSRMATVKNALGKWVDIITPWQPPGTWTSDTTFTYITNGVWAGGTKSGPTVNNTATAHSYVWDVTYVTARTAPGVPFTAYSVSGGFPTVGSGGVALPAQDIVGKTADRVNWALETFSNTSSTLVADITFDTLTGDQTSVTAIENTMRLNSAGGLGAGGSTPTKIALTNAATALSGIHGRDPKVSCGRSYGVVLVTDGLSNNGNPDDGNWAEPGLPCPGTGCPDGGSSGYTCPDHTSAGVYDSTSYEHFAAGAAEDLWNQTAGGARLNSRTWAIGISYAVGRCELNMTAYMGRTDASSPNGDTGFFTASDPYLPQGTGDIAHYQPNSGGHGDYAFFATSATALAYAFSSIVASAGIGDFSTAAPVVSTAISGGTDIAYLASAEAPGWKGHFYAYDVHNTAAPVLNWDGGKMLTPPWTDSQGATRGRNLTAAPRAIYTWDSSGTLVNLGAYSTVSSIPSSLTLPSGFDNRVLDYLKGFDGTRSGTQRSWVLGPILNSTAAVFSAPEAWKTNTLPDHKSFETTYARRHAMVMVGTSDGMMHVFDVADGYEVYAILPPDQLANQVLLYNSYQSSRGSRVTGEPIDTSAHIYGIASPPRFADVYISGQYHTALVLTEGRGGSTMAAIDITHSYPGRTGVVLPYDPPSKTQDYPADANYSSSAPISLLWSQTSSSLSGLKQTWSVPAVGATSTSNFDCISGSGYYGCSGYTPKLFPLNMADGASRVSSGNDLTNASSGSLVYNQAYGAGVFYNVTAPVPKVYDVQNLGVISDTHGRVWFYVPSTGAVVKAIDVGANQPIYYTPAVGYYSNKNIYAFASGNLYETAPAIVGSSSTFVPTLYITAKSADATAALSTDTYSIALTSISVVTDATTTPPTSRNLSSRSQVTADPVLFIPASAGNPVKAFFLVYDPTAGTCVGNSYLIELDLPLDFATNTNWRNSVTKSSMSLGSGVASGFAFSGGKIIVARSAVGGGQVTPQAAGEGPSPLGEAPALSSWIELK